LRITKKYKHEKSILKQLLAHLAHNLKFHLPLDSERYDSIMENEPFRLALPFMDESEKSKLFDSIKESKSQTN